MPTRFKRSDTVNYDLPYEASDFDNVRNEVNYGTGGTIIYEVIGCMNKAASNYDPRATVHAPELCEFDNDVEISPYVAETLEKLFAENDLQSIGNEPLIAFEGSDGTSDRYDDSIRNSDSTNTDDREPTEIDPDFVDPDITATRLPADESNRTIVRYDVRIIGDVSSDDIIKYQLNGIDEFVSDGMDVVRSITKRPIKGVDRNPPTISLERIGVTPSTHNVRYEITYPETSLPVQTENDFTKTLTPGTTIIKVIANRLVDEVSPNTPTVSVNDTSLQFNYLSDSVISIPYYTMNADYITYSIAGTTRTINKTRTGKPFGFRTNGTLHINKSDFKNGIGSYTLYIQPVSYSKGSGQVKRIVINVISKEYLPGPDITHISYPANIKGSSFSGFNVDFRIGWQSVNTNYVEVYVSKYDRNYALARVEPNGTLTLNITDVLKKGKYATGIDVGKVRFDLILVPFNTETSSKVSGKREVVSILFDKGDLRLRRNQVISDLKKAFKQTLKRDVLETETSKYLTHYAHFLEGDNRLISNWAIDKETFSEYYTNPETNKLRKTKEVKTLVLKLYEPLPAVFQPNQKIWISKIQSVPIIDQIVLEEVSQDACTPLRPNFDIDLGDEVGYQILDELMASGSATTSELLDSYINSNEFSLDKLSIEYTDESNYLWENFINFSSASERVDNFFYKVKLIEYHNNKIDNLSTLPQTISVKNEIEREEEKTRDVIRGFDAFEKHLYRVDDPLSYPGAGQSAVSASTDSSVESWYTGIKSSATEFDATNKNLLVNNLPQHIKDDEEGQDFILFFNMIGQHFDILSNYIKGLETSKDLAHKHDNGIANDLIYHMLESLGWDADMGVKSQYLWEYAFGISKDGQDLTFWSGKRRQQEIWRRLLNNLPYLYKHKGTKRALAAAMACYGIPTSMLTILEFGGPNNTNLLEESGTTQVTFDDRTAALSFTAGTHVNVPYHVYTETSAYPQCVEIRVQTDVPDDYTILLTEGWKLEILNTTGDNAQIRFTHDWNGIPATATTGEMYFFNDEYKTIVVQRTVDGSGNSTFDIYVKEGGNDRIVNSVNASLDVIVGNSTWNYGLGLDIGTDFVGNVDDFRLWTVPLNESRIDNHTLMPDAIDGNDVRSSTEDLIFRLDFEYPKDRSSSTGDVNIKNVAINTTYGEPYATAVGFPSITDYPYNYTPYQRTVTADVPSTGLNYANKIRFEDQTLETHLKYGEHTGVTTDGNKLDSNKLGLFFSPMKEINLDILKSLGSFSIDNYIGDPGDMYEDSYTELEDLRDYYFRRFNLNIYEYIQLVRYIDQTLFTTLESLVPARAKVSSGLLIEPHILERSKIKKRKPTGNELSHETTIPVNDDTIQTAEYEPYDVEIDTQEDIDIKTENPFYNALVDTTDETELNAEKLTYDANIDYDDTFELIATPLTYEALIDAQYTGSVYGEYFGITLTQIGMNPDSIHNAGFGIWGKNGHTIRTYIDKDNNRIKDRKKVYKIKEAYTIKVPQNIDPTDETAGTNLVPVTKYRYRVTFIDFDTPAPTTTGNIVEVTPLDGYFPSHYKYVGDLTTGLQNSYYNGSTQTDLTTLDGGSPVQTFTTNPNVLKVTDTGRGAGEPILEVD